MQAGDYISSAERRAREAAAASAATSKPHASASFSAADAAHHAPEASLVGKHPLLAFVAILVVVVTWIAKMALVQDMQTGTGGGVGNGGGSGGGNSTAPADSTAYNKPFLTAYLNGSTYAFFGFIFLVFHLRLTHYLLVWAAWKCCGYKRKRRGGGGMDEGADAVVLEVSSHGGTLSKPRRRDSHSLSLDDTGTGREDLYEHAAAEEDEDNTAMCPRSAATEESPDPDPATENEETILSNDGLTPTGSYHERRPTAVVKPPSAPTAAAQSPPVGNGHGRNESLGNALLLQHLDRSAAAQHQAQARAMAARRKRKLQRVAALADSSHLPPLTRAERALLPQYSRLMRAAFCLSFLYQLCGWLTNASLNDTSLSVNTAVWNSGCVLVFLLEGLFLPGHTLRNGQKLLGVIVCAAGVAVIAAAPADKSDDSTATPTTAWGVTQVLLALVIYSVYEVLFKYLSEPKEKTKSAGAGVGEDEEDEPSLAKPSRNNKHGSRNKSSKSLSSDAPAHTHGYNSLALGINDQAASNATASEKLLQAQQQQASSPLSGEEAEDDEDHLNGGRFGSSSSFSSSSFVAVPGLITAASANSLQTASSSGSSLSRKPSAAAADPATATTKEKGPSAMQSIWSSFLFLGTMGLTTMCCEWVMVLLLNYTGLEKLQRPSPEALRIILASMVLDTLLNVSILCAIALSTALFVNCGILLTIPCSMVYDRVFHHQSQGWISILGVVLLVLGFLGLNLPRPGAAAAGEKGKKQALPATAYNSNGISPLKAAPVSALSSSSRHHSSSGAAGGSGGGLPIPPAIGSQPATASAAASLGEYQYIQPNSVEEAGGSAAGRHMSRASLGMLSTHLLAE